MALVALGVLVSVLLWVCTYRALCLLNSRCSAEWNCRLVTAAHGVLITCLSYKNGFIDNRWPFTDPGLPNSQYEEQIIVLCLGYFLFDFSWCVYHGTEGMVMLTHHCASIFGLAAALILGVSGTDVIGVIFGAELTNPFLQLRWFFKETGRYCTLPAEINDLLFISLFAGVRIGVGGYFFYTEWTNKRPLMLFKKPDLSQKLRYETAKGQRSACASFADQLSSGGLWTSPDVREKRNYGKIPRDFCVNTTRSCYTHMRSTATSEKWRAEHSLWISPPLLTGTTRGPTFQQHSHRPELLRASRHQHPYAVLNEVLCGASERETWVSFRRRKGTVLAGAAAPLATF
ncbi:hypothetical protein Bbelb_252140 [Branchiostoma belcheri]|nr:hypothetical protein Bbelb_252140 [Branchiostoma belcheri]